MNDYLNDYHTHTSFSNDCQVPMDEMIRGAITKGVKELAITDHYDPGYADPDFPFLLDFPAYHKALLDAEVFFQDEITIIKGMELGIMEGQFDEGRRQVAAFPYDFVIGAFHSFRKATLYHLDFSNLDGSVFLRDFYCYMAQCLKEFKDYDILGHLTIPDRYMSTVYDYTPIMDIMEEILKTIIYDGKGLEINTSSFRYDNDPWLPRKEILKFYRELGGEILTLGSDSHSPDFFLSFFEEAVELAKSLGFRYLATYSNRQPSFHPL